MALTSFQKEIVNKIENREIYDLASFFRQCLELKDAKVAFEEPDYRLHNRTVSMGLAGRSSYIFKESDPIRVFVNEELSLSKLVAFIDLLQKLQKNDLILPQTKRPKGEDDKFFTYIFRETSSGKTIFFHKLHAIILPYLDLTFYPSPSLNDFIARKFLTIEEDSYEQEKRSRILSQWTAIIIPIIIATLTIFLQWILSSNERKIIVLNKDAFKDTIKVILVNDKIHK